MNSGKEILWRWLSLGLVILTLLAYPLARRTGFIHPQDQTPSVQTLVAASFQLFQAGRYADAISISLEALKRDPNSADAYNNLAISYAATKQWDLALQNVEAAERINPNYPLTRNNMAWIVEQRRKNASSSAPPTPKTPSPPKPATPTTPIEAMLSGAAQLYQTRRYEEAIKVSREVLKIAPKAAEAFNILAISYAAIGQWDPAFANSLVALRLQPDFQLARNNLAWMIQQRQAAAPPVPSAQEPEETPEFYLDKSLREYQAARYQASLDAARRAVKLRWSYAEAYNNMAVADIQLKHYDEAIDAAMLATFLKSDFKLAENNLQWARDEKTKAGGHRRPLQKRIQLLR